MQPAPSHHRLLTATMVPLTYTQWLQVNKKNGNVANLASLQVFYGKYVKPEMDRLKEKAAHPYWNSGVRIRRQVRAVRGSTSTLRSSGDGSMPDRAH